MRSTITEGTPSTEYPCLKRFTAKNLEFIVLFTAPETGTVVEAGKNHHPLGHHSDMWSECMFERFNGAVLLEN